MTKDEGINTDIIKHVWLSSESLPVEENFPRKSATYELTNVKKTAACIIKQLWPKVRLGPSGVLSFKVRP